jgi:predicted small lipoprotein YifL
MIMSQCKAGNPGSLFIITAILFCALSASVLTGCGQKGGLYLPDEETQKQENEKAKKKKAEPAADTTNESESEQQ